MSIFPGCEKSVHDLNPSARVCSEQHCDQFTESETFHQDCNTFGKGHPLYPVSTSQCINTKSPHDIKEPVNGEWGWSCPDGYALQRCYCCCSCLANGTPVAIPGGTKAIQLFNQGDEVSVAKYGKEGLSWHTGIVEFSSGSDAGSVATMIFVDCVDGRQLIASIDHLFLLATGKLKRADRLVPAMDQLMSAEGLPIDIKGTHSGKWTKGLHHIATSPSKNLTLDDHLINSAGIVSGDYYLQINQKKLIESGIMDGPESSPAHGSADYAEQHQHLAVSTVSAILAGTNPDDVNTPDGFEHFNPTSTIPIPEHAASFLTEAQAQDILTNKDAEFNDIHISAGEDAIEYLIKVFKGFYPDIQILLDYHSEKFNAYAFEIYETRHIVICGGIARLKGLYSQGYKFIMAQMIARLLRRKPFGDRGFTYVGAADFYATSEVFRNVFFLAGDDLSNGVLDQMKMVFKLISPKNSAGNPNDLANDPSIKCRYGNLQTGIFGGSVLGCACDDLALKEASPEKQENGEVVLILKFNKAVDPKSAEKISNYTFSATHREVDLPTISDVKTSAAHPEWVGLQLDKAPNGNFTINVANITAVNGSQLGDSDSATFSL
ncbi:MAG: hypothetical protein AAFZ63_10115 [Bacteroidota bacterium]